jgi:calcineurin-like phosphoesterase family protein
MKLVRGRPFEPDLPVPANFALVEQASEDRSTGTRRLYLRHVYTGSADKYAVRNFYREQMPLARWTKVSDGNVQGFLTMRFEKNDESCSVTITGSAHAFSNKTKVQIVVAREEWGQKPPNTRTES